MVLWIIFGSFCFGRAYSIAGAADLITNLVVGLNVPAMSFIWAMMLILFVLGMFMGTAEICVLTTPIFLPIIHHLGFDPVWYGVLFVINAEMGLLSPPFGMTLFWLKGVAPPDISMGDIYSSVWPFIGVQAACLLLVMYIPQIAMWFPSVLS
jgi:TRAP-type mannitol/chloroaromatic compound transport system permease large subunit